MVKTVKRKKKMRKGRGGRSGRNSSAPSSGLMVGFSAVAGMVVLVCIVLSTVLVTTLAPAPRSGSNETVPELAENPWSCPEIEFVYQPGSKEFGGICLAWYNDTTLYYFKWFSGTPEMRAITFNENRTEIISETGNLLQGGFTGEAFLDCTYLPQNDTFFVIGDNPTLTRISPDGTILSSVNVDDTLFNDASTTSLFYDQNGQFYVDNTYSQNFGGSYRTLDVETGLVGPPNVVSDELLFGAVRFTGGEYNRADGRIYMIRDQFEQYEPPSLIGVLNQEQNIFERVCSPTIAAQTKFATISFDVDGIPWVGSGGQATLPFLPQSIYRFDQPFFPINSTAPSTFTLECTESIQAPKYDMTSYPARNFSITGTGCQGGEVRVVSVAHNLEDEFQAVGNTEMSTRKVSKSIIKPPLAHNKRSQTVYVATSHSHFAGHLVNTTAMLDDQGKRKRNLVYNSSITGSFRGTSGGSTNVGLDFRDPSVPEDAYYVMPGLYRSIKWSPQMSAQQLRSFLISDQQSLAAPFALTLVLDMITGDCADYSDNQRLLRFDHAANKTVFGWTTNSRSKLCIFVSEANYSAFDQFEFDFAGQNITKLEFSVWGEQYNLCWNDLLAVNPWSKCFVLERERMLNPSLGMPRLVAIPALNISTSYPVSSMPLHQEYGATAPLSTAYPCGVLVGSTAQMGGVINLKLCQSVDFDLAQVVASDSLTTIGTYDDGSSGTCASVTACIVTSNTVLDPNRYDLISTFRYFPELMAQRLGVAIVVDANGAGDSKILTGTFTVDNMGMLTSEGTLQTYNPTTNDQYNPSIAFTNDAVFWLRYREIVNTGADTQLFIARLFYNQTTFVNSLTDDDIGVPLGDNRWEVPAGQNAIVNNKIVVSPGYNSTILSSDPVTICPSPCSVFSRNVPRMFNTRQRFGTKYFAVDDCNQFATCLSTVEFD